MEKKSATLYSIYYIIICGAKRDVRENNNSIISLKLIFKNDLYTERGEVCGDGYFLSVQIAPTMHLI